MERRCLDLKRTRLADKAIYLASESTFYRLLRAEKLMNQPGTFRKRKRVPQLKEPVTTGPNELYSWDITEFATLRYAQQGIQNECYLLINCPSEVDTFRHRPSDNSLAPS